VTAGRREDYVNLIADGSVRWRSIHSFDSDLEETMYNWQDRNHELSTRRCASVKVVLWIRI
jgi:hypothetical protein